MRRLLLLLALLVAPSLVCAQSIVWPGQSGNPVGYAAYGSGIVGGAACPSPTSGTAGNPTIIKNCTYTSLTNLPQSYVWLFQVDFANGTGGLNVTGSHDLLIGCRSQSNSVANFNVKDSGTGNWFLYDSVVPLTSFVTSPPGYSIWPSAEAQQNTSTQIDGVNSTGGNDGYQYGILANSATNQVIDHADIWGFGNSVDYEGGTHDSWLLESWIHDAAYAATQGYHTDGPGYLDGTSGTAPWNMTIQGNTVESLGPTNGLAMQQAPVGGNGYQNMNIVENLWGAFERTISPGDIGSQNFTNSPLVQNVYDTSIPPEAGVFHGTTLGAGSVWACNTIKIAPNTTWSDSDGWTPTSGENGEFFVLNLSAPASPTDQGGNTTCATTIPASIDFLTQNPGTSSSPQTITLKNTGSSTLTISSIAMQTGTNFSVSSNTCGASLAPGSSCAIAVRFSPTASTQAVYQDQLAITDSMPSSASPQLVPVIGVGLTGAPGSPGTSRPNILMGGVAELLFGVPLL